MWFQCLFKQVKCVVPVFVLQRSIKKTLMAINKISNIDDVYVGADDDGDVSQLLERTINNLLRLSDLLSIKEIKYIFSGIFRFSVMTL